MKKSLWIWLFFAVVILIIVIIGYQFSHTKTVRVYALRMVSCLQGNEPSFNKDPDCKQWVKKAEMQSDGVIFYSQNYDLTLSCKLNLSANNVKCNGEPSKYFPKKSLEIPVATLAK